eukprot:2675724-Rhodomonas_salina.1
MLAERKGSGGSRRGEDVGGGVNVGAGLDEEAQRVHVALLRRDERRRHAALHSEHQNDPSAKRHCDPSAPRDTSDSSASSAEQEHKRKGGRMRTQTLEGMT